MKNDVHYEGLHDGTTYSHSLIQIESSKLIIFS